MNAYKIDYTANTITITAAFAKAMQNPDSAEYKLIKKIQHDFPKMEIVSRSHKRPSAYHSKSGETFNCNPFKNLKYENMERFINALPNSEKYWKEYETARAMSFAQTNGYAHVRKWFVAQFPKFRSNPLFYVSNVVELVSAAKVATEMEEENEFKKVSNF